MLVSLPFLRRVVAAAPADDACDGRISYLGLSVAPSGYIFRKSCSKSDDNP